MIFSFFDSETTGFKHSAETNPDRVIELCIIRYKFDGTDFTKERTYLQRFNPDRNIPADSYEVHGIRFEDVEHEPLFKDKAVEVYSELSTGGILVAHNLNFDRNFVAAEFARCGITWTQQGIDTAGARWATAFGKTPKLEELCFALGVDYDPELAHSAEYDVQVMAEAFIAGWKLGWFNAEMVS